MAIKRKTYRGVPVDCSEAFVCDTASDLSSLPTTAAQGSTAFVIEDSTTWMIDSAGQWQQTIVSGGGDITTIRLDVSKNGTYLAPTGKAYNRVLVGVDAVPEASSDGSIHIKVHFDPGPAESLKMHMSWQQTEAYGVSFDWGDGTAAQTYAGTGYAAVTYAYQEPGDYDIVISVISGSLAFVGVDGTNGYAIYGTKDAASNYWKTKITEVSFGDDVTSVDPYCLQYSYSLRGVNVGDGITSVGDGAFSYCYSLRDIALPDSLTTIGDNAFYYCHCLESISIPDAVTSIGDGAFQNCFALKSVTLPPDIQEIGETTFYNCYNLRHADIPDQVTTIDVGAFGNCFALSSVTIPSSVTLIDSDAFANCYGVQEYHIEATTPPTLRSTSVFTGMSSNCVIYVPYSADHSILNAYKAATNWSSFASKMQEEAL